MKILGLPGTSFSPRRVLGIDIMKRDIVRAIGIPTTKQGIERKIGRTIIKESLNSKMKGFRSKLRGGRDLLFFFYRCCMIFG